jgi:hypothetical protein
MIEIAAIPQSEMAGGPFAPGWKGRSQHIGPVGVNTPLVEALSGKTTCATVVLMSGVLLWGYHRLRHFTESDFYVELAEAIFAWQYDWRYVDIKAAPYFSPPQDPPEEVALYTLDNFVRAELKLYDKWISFYQPVMPLFHMCNMVNFILPKAQRPHFEGWLSGMIQRLDEIAAAPDMDEPDFYDFENKAAYAAHCAPRRGPPLPPIVLDLETDLTGTDLQAEADTFLQSLDHTKNRFLRSPEQLLEMGFEGLPYGRAP